MSDSEGQAGGQRASALDGAGRHWFQDLDIKDGLTKAMLDDYFRQGGDRMKADMQFLGEGARRYRGLSNGLRLVGVVAVGCGILFPAIFANSTPFPGPLKLSAVEAGYIAVAAGGILLLLDQVFDLTNGWIRLFIAESKMKSVLEQLEFDWIKDWSPLTGAEVATEGPKLVDKLKAASLASHQIMEEQKIAWTTAIRAANETLRARLESDRATYQKNVDDLRDERERPTAGSINVKIANPQLLKGPVAIKLDGEMKATHPSVPSGWALLDVPAGEHMVTIEAAYAAAGGGAHLDGKADFIVAGRANDFVFTVPPAA